MKSKNSMITFNDILNLSYLQEVIVQHLKCRYANNMIYTYMGDILIAVNPFKDVNMYGEEVKQ